MLSLHHFDILIRLLCKLRQSYSVSIFINIFKSSAKTNFSQLSSKQRSFIKSKNNRGPKLDPCETPKLAQYSTDSCPFYVTNCDRLSKEDPKKVNNFVLKPKHFNFLNKIPWSMRSKALEKSVYTTSTLPWLSSLLDTNCVNNIRFVVETYRLWYKPARPLIGCDG